MAQQPPLQYQGICRPPAMLVRVTQRTVHLLASVTSKSDHIADRLADHIHEWLCVAHGVLFPLEACTPQATVALDQVRIPIEPPASCGMRCVTPTGQLMCVLAAAVALLRQRTVPHRQQCSSSAAPAAAPPAKLQVMDDGPPVISNAAAALSTTVGYLQA